MRGAAAALLMAGTLGGAASAAAQGVGSVDVRTRDTTIVLRMTAPTRAQMDSLRVLMATLEQLPPDSRARAVIEKQIQALLPLPARASGMVFRGQAYASPKGWIGINAEGPHEQMITPREFVVEYFDYPSITSVDPDSPAQRAGIMAGDVLVGYNGTDVVGHRFDLTQMLVPDRKLSVTVRRDGTTKDYAVTVARAPENVFLRRQEMGPMASGQLHIEQRMKGDENVPRVMAMPRLPGMGGEVFSRRSFIITPNGAFGAILSSVSPELAKAFRIETGVLVNDVTDDTPASRAGLRSGDVIVSAAGQPVENLRQLQEMIAKRMAEQSIALQVMRERKARKITVSW